MNRKIWLTSLIGLMVLGCGDDTVSGDTDEETDTEDSTSTSTSTTTSTTTTTTTTPTGTSATSGETDTETGPDTDTTTTDPMTSSSSSTGDPESSSSSTTSEEIQDPVDFVLTIENISAGTVLQSPFSPGVWAEHATGDVPVFDANMADRGNGLVEIAEDGIPTTLAASLAGQGDVISSGVFDTPVGGAMGPLAPGESYEVTFTAQPESRLSFATMLVQTNDIFLGTGPNGIALFAANGNPLGERDVSDVLAFWDVGSEANQPPAGGAYQAPNGPAIGPDESGVVSLRNESTHAIPLASKLANVEVTYDAVTFAFSIEIENISDAEGSLVSPLSPMVWALHDETVGLFTPGAAAGGDLEALAEDGDTAPLVATLGGLAGIDQSGGIGPAAPGSSSIIADIVPLVAGRFLSVATMVTESNDAFLAAHPEGIALLDDMGNPRSTNAIERDFDEMFSVWDAGTEANQTPGLGADTAENQDFANTGVADPDATVRFYQDATNDLAGPNVGDFFIVSVTNGVSAGDFDVTIENSSNGDLQGIMTPAAWSVHDGTFNIFTMGMPASPALEELAEDGVPVALDAEATTAAVADNGIAGAMGVPTGGIFSFSFTTTAADPFLNFATMIVPSNDTFASLGAQGIDLYGGGANPLSDGEIADLVLAALNAYDAGTEQNQAGGAGRDMAPFGAANTGVNEGTGLIRQAGDDPVWGYPAPEQVVLVTIAPAP